jgi:hypothetical protein
MLSTLHRCVEHHQNTTEYYRQPCRESPSIIERVFHGFGWHEYLVGVAILLACLLLATMLYRTGTTSNQDR